MPRQDRLHLRAYKISLRVELDHALSFFESRNYISIRGLKSDTADLCIPRSNVMFVL